MAKVKKKFPYELYDVAGLEDWFAQMAAQGYHLEDCWGDKAQFTLGEPKHNVRYRLEAQQTYQYDWNKDREYAEQGWHHVTTIIGFFYIFRCDDPEIEELHTDPTIQSWTMKKLIRRQAFWFVWWPLYWLFMMRGSVGTLLTYPSILAADLLTSNFLLVGYAVMLAGITYLIICQIVQFNALRRLRQRLASGLPMDRTKHYPRSFWRHGFSWLLYGLTIAVMIAALLMENQRQEEFRLEDYPHITLEDVLPGQVRRSYKNLNYWQGQQLGKSLLVPVQLVYGDAAYWEEDGSKVRIHLTYYEARFPEAAKLLLKGQLQDQARGMETERDWYENHPDMFSKLVLDTGPVPAEHEGLDELLIWDTRYEDNHSLNRHYFGRKGSMAFELTVTIPQPEQALELMVERMEGSP